MLRHITHSVEHHVFHREAEMKELGFFMILRTTALSLFGIFIPIYFYSLGMSLPSIFLYYLVAYLTEALFEYPSVKLSRKIGPKKTIILSTPFLIIYFYMLSSIGRFGWSVELMGFVVGIALAMFWQPYHYLYSKYKDGKKASEQVSMRVAMVNILGALGPALGGFFIATLGATKLLYLIIFLLILASLFLLRGYNEKITEPFGLKKLNLKKFALPAVSYVGYTWEETTVSVIWPFFVYLLIGTFQGVGALTSLTLLTTVAITLMIGKISDSGKRPLLIKEGSLFNLFIDICRIISTTFYHVLAVNILRSISAAIFSSPFVSEYYLHADEEIRDEYIFVMETATDLSRVLYFAVLVLVAIYLGPKAAFLAALVMGSFGALLSGLMPPCRRDIKLQNKNIKIMPRPKNNAARVSL